MKEEPIDLDDIKDYVDNLDEEGARQALMQLLAYPESQKHLTKCIKEFKEFYKYPLGKNQ